MRPKSECKFPFLTPVSFVLVLHNTGSPRMEWEHNTVIFGVYKGLSRRVSATGDAVFCKSSSGRSRQSRGCLQISRSREPPGITTKVATSSSNIYQSHSKLRRQLSICLQQSATAGGIGILVGFTIDIRLISLTSLSMEKP